MKRIALMFSAAALFTAAPVFCGSSDKEKKAKDKPSALDQYVKDAETRATEEGAAMTPGSAWSGYSNMMDLTRDLRASRIDDVITVIVAESASATTSGNTQADSKVVKAADEMYQQINNVKQ